jgi:hypothetical protein
MDHHCAFVNNCVGANNYKFFFLLLVYTTVGGLYNAAVGYLWLRTAAATVAANSDNQVSQGPLSSPFFQQNDFHSPPPASRAGMGRGRGGREGGREGGEGGSGGGGGRGR